jgi:hypothetical protein
MTDKILFLKKYTALSRVKTKTRHQFTLRKDSNSTGGAISMKEWLLSNKKSNGHYADIYVLMHTNTHDGRTGKVHETLR